MTEQAEKYRQAAEQMERLAELDEEEEEVKRLFDRLLKEKQLSPDKSHDSFNSLAGSYVAESDDSLNMDSTFNNSFDTTINTTDNDIIVTLNEEQNIENVATETKQQYEL